MHKAHGRVFLIVILVLFVTTSGFCAQTISEQSLMQGTRYETNAYFIDSGIAGNTVLIVGGTHGDEVAGWTAVSNLTESYRNGQLTLKSGKLILIPKVNTVGVRARTRNMDEDNLNRMYPGDPNGIAAERLADQVTGIMQQYSVTMVIDCHEALGYNKNGGLGNTIIGFYKQPDQIIANGAIAYINEQAKVADAYRWSLRHSPVPGSTAWQAGQLGIIGYTIETCRKENLAYRVKQQLYALEYLLRQQGLY